MSASAPSNLFSAVCFGSTLVGMCGGGLCNRAILQSLIMTLYRGLYISAADVAALTVDSSLLIDTLKLTDSCSRSKKREKNRSGSDLTPIFKQA